MAFTEEIKKAIDEYCLRDLSKDDWYEKEFNFIKDTTLKNRIVCEFKNVRYIYKIFEGLAAKDELYLAEVRLQILMYASIYEAVIHYLLFEEYYKNNEKVKDLLIQKVNKPFDIPTEKQAILESHLSHDGKQVIPYFSTTQKRDITKIRFDEKCKLAFELGILSEIPEQSEHPSSIINSEDCKDIPMFCAELIRIYEIRNAIHIHAELKKDIDYQIELSKVAYRRMMPFISQIKSKLIKDGLYNE